MLLQLLLWNELHDLRTCNRDVDDLFDVALVDGSLAEQMGVGSSCREYTKPRDEPKASVIGDMVVTAIEVKIDSLAKDGSTSWVVISYGC